MAGWAILLDYLILIAITAYATTDYLAPFWSGFATGAPQLIFAIGVIVYVALVNARGAGSRRWERAALVVLADLALQLLIVVLGLALLFEPEVLTDPAAIAGAPGARTSCSRSRSRSLRSPGWTPPRRSPARSPSRAAGSSGCSSSVPPPPCRTSGIGLVASSVLPQTGGRWYEAPMLGLVSSFEQAWLREPLRYLGRGHALALLVIACNAAMFGLSRLGYSLALNRQIPSPSAACTRASTPRSC